MSKKETGKVKPKVNDKKDFTKKDFMNILGVMVNPKQPPVSK